MEHFSELIETLINSSIKSCQWHAVFHSFLYDDSKQDADTTTPHNKRLIDLLKERKELTSSLSTIKENTDDCGVQYICASALYILSLISQCYSVIIDRGISKPGH